MDILNTQIEIVVGGENIKARMINIGELFGYFENIIKEEKISDAQKMAETLNGSDKADFLFKAYNALPNGDEIIGLASDRVASLKGCKEVIYLATKDFNEKITSPNYFNNLITVDNIKELDPIIQRLTGLGDVKKNTKKKKN